jgi:Mg/Co/Ni transporter MgtE
MKKLVKELMVDKCVRVHRNDQIYEAADKVSKDPETLLACVVDDEDRLVGVITPKELLKAAEVCEYGGAKNPFVSGREALHLLTSKYARDIMSDPVSVTPDDDVQKAIDLMLYKGFYEIPVVDKKGKLIGEITYFQIISHTIWQCNLERE